MKSIIPAVTIERRIYLIRGHKVMLDSDLAELYDVTTGNLNKAVTRNIDRFPADFMKKHTYAGNRRAGGIDYKYQKKQPK